MFLEILQSSQKNICALGLQLYEKRDSAQVFSCGFPIYNKILEPLIYNEMFTFFTENNLISPNQSGFRPGDSCVNQLLDEYIDHLMRGLKLEGFS